jgi:hypothetical protein
MNKPYLALIVLCLCGASTVSLVPLVKNSPSGLIFLIFPIVWAIAACSLSAIALAGGRGVVAVTVLLVAYAIYELRKESKEMRRQAAAVEKNTGSTR